MKTEWVIAGILGLVALLWFNPQLLHQQPRQPMPIPSTPSTPAPTDGKQTGVVQARRIEIIDATGKVSCVLDTTNTGAPIAIVNDGGKAITIDLLKVARYAR